MENVQAQIAGEPAGNGYLRTGDLGFIRDGELFVCGRPRDMLVLNGRNVLPGDVEALLEESFPKLLAGRVAAFGLHHRDAGTEHLVVLVEAGADAVNLKRLRGLVQDGCDVSVGTIARVQRGTIVHTSSGKVVFSVGIPGGWAAGSFGHELMHRPTRGEWFLAQVLLARRLDAPLAIEHVYGHHRHVGLATDIATTPRGMTFWRYLPRAICGVYGGASGIEARRMRRGHAPGSVRTTAFSRASCCKWCSLVWLSRSPARRESSRLRSPPASTSWSSKPATISVTTGWCARPAGRSVPAIRGTPRGSFRRA
ncbi:MAG: hypothetical protein F9K43_00030 [Bauldia sp.]|nr:MAG: hypothetical protein F9K43_00030 [Bauldia sp.]